MLNQKKIIGTQAEDTAIVFLRQYDYIILARNINFYGVEIDILCKYQYNYIFIEVKSIKRYHYQSGYTVLAYKQWLRYQQAIQAWYTDSKKCHCTSIGLIIFDENMQLIDFNNNICF